MPNRIKYTTTPTANTIKVGSFALGVVTGVTYAPTSTTSFYNGYNVPSGGYVVYQNKATLGPSVFVPTGDTQMINLTKSLGNATATTIYDSLKWINEQNTIIAVNREYENIVTSGLTMLLDAGFTPSYPKSGTSWTDVSFSGNNGTLTNGPTFSSENGGSIVFDGVDDYIDNIGSTSSFDFIGSTGIFSIGFWFKMNATNTRTLFIGNTLTNTEKGWLIGVEYGAAGYGNNCIRFQATGNASNTRLIAGSTNDNTIDATTWTHCLFTSSSGNYVGQWYINGVASTTSTRVGTGNDIQGSYYGGPAARTLNIGRSNYSSTIIPLAGNVASVFIYNRTLSATEVLQNYNAQKSRYIASFDADAQAFITAAAITDPTQQTAINTLVVGLKADSIWTKMKAIYPIVGGTATNHKYNLKDPRDLDVAFRLVFSGGITHSSNGMLPNGTTGYADTKLIPYTNISNAGSTHFSAYFRTTSTGNPQIGADIIFGIDGDTYSDGPSQFLIPNGSTCYYGLNTNDSFNYFKSFTDDATTLGLYVVNRNTANTIKIFKNNTLKTTGTDFNTPSAPTISFYLMGMNQYYPDASFYNTYYGNRQLAFATIGDGLTDTDASNLYTRVQAFQTSLSRQV